MDTLVSMRVFRQVVDSGGFTAASDTLDMSVATVSKHVQHLETQLGIRLLHRTSRRMSLTAAGSVYYEHCCETLDKHDKVKNEVLCTNVCPQGLLRIAAPTWFANKFFADLLHSYSRQFPLVSLDLSLSDGRSDLVEDGLDLALRVTRDPDPRLPSRELGKIKFCLAASEDYLQREGEPQSVADLRNHEMIAYAHYDGWIELPQPARPGRWRLDNTTLIAHLAAQGLGIAMLPDVLIEQEPSLRPVLAHLELPPASLLAVTHRSRHLTVRASSLLEHLAAHFGNDVSPAVAAGAAPR